MLQNKNKEKAKNNKTLPKITKGVVSIIVALIIPKGKDSKKEISGNFFESH